MKIPRGEKSNPTVPTDSEKVGLVDYDINLKELNKTAYILRLNKANGFDSFSK